MSKEYEDWESVRIKNCHLYCDFGEELTKESLYQEFKDRLMKELADDLGYAIHEIPSVKTPK